MRKATASTLAVGMLLSAGLPGSVAAAPDPSEQLMLARADFWRVQQRPDLVSDILNRILAANPGQPDALYQQGVLAIEQGDRGGAERYFDRLRQLAGADKHAAELVALLAQPAAIQATPAPSTTPTGAAVVTKFVAVAASPAPATPVAAHATILPQEIAQLAAVSADSEDLTPAKPAPIPAVLPAVPAGAAPRALAAAVSPVPAPGRQMASLPPATVSDSDPVIPARASAALPAGSADLAITAKSVQLAQVELEPPPPIGGISPVAVALKPYSPSDTLETYIDRDLARLQAESNPTLIAGLGFRAHSGAEGIGSLTEVGLTGQVSFSPWYTGTATIAVLPVYLDAGTPANGNLAAFGTNPILAALGLPSAAAGSQNASGVGLLGSYTYGEFSGQVGTTPLGFPVTNIIGNVAYTPKFFDGMLAVRIEGQRQPVTDSVISYAGTRANLGLANAVTGGAFSGSSPTWGGVVKTGPHILAFYDDQSVGFYGGAGYSWFTGTNVAGNAAVDALLGGYFRPWKSDWGTLRVGVSLYYTGYDKNLGGPSYGQGEYFSPRNFEGLGFPVELTGRNGAWSYLASATLGVQDFNADSSPVFPTNPSAQAFLQRVSPATAFTSSVHGGIGFGFNLKGQVEYAIDPTAAIGLAGSFNNSNSYDDGIVQVYLRKTFDWFAPAAFKNDPQSIVARDQPIRQM